MNKTLASLIDVTASDQRTYRPVFYRLGSPEDRDSFYALLEDNASIRVFDQLEGQLAELIKSMYPTQKIKGESMALAIENHLGNVPMEEYGVWVYYPWSNRMVHILDENEFIRVRTNRNQYKITPEEHDLLATRKVGVIGLSVGQSVAITMAMERCFGEIRLADFDLLELSNLNRIRTGLHNLGVSKVISAAREIAEIDPFLKVNCTADGITEENIEDFLLEGGKLDLLIDECDSIDIKVLCRQKAKSHSIPLVMEASDRGCIDVERYDLEPERPIFHGLMKHLDTSKMKGLTNEQKIPYLLSIHPPDTLSKRMKASMMEVEESITTWPQLASAVTLGGAISTDVCRRILLGQFKASGRYFVDLDEIISENKKEDKSSQHPDIESIEQEHAELKSIFNKLTPPDFTMIHLPDRSTVESLVEAAVTAPSGGNSQPWYWIYEKGLLALFLDKNRSLSFMDYKNHSSYIALGAALENLSLKARQAGLLPEITLFPENQEGPLIASITFPKSKKLTDSDKLTAGLEDYIGMRCTNRIIEERQPIAPEILHNLRQLVQHEEGASLQFLDNTENINGIAEIFGRAERIRLLNPRSHHDFFVRELRWNTTQSQLTMDGVDLMTMNLSDSDIAGLHVAKDPVVMQMLRGWNKGTALLKIRRKTVKAASAIGLISLPGNEPSSHVKAGRLVERIWLAAQQHGISFQPLYVPLTLFSRLKDRDNELPDDLMQEVAKIKSDFLTFFPNNHDHCEKMLFRLCIANEPKVKSLRRPVKDVLLFL